MEMEIAENREKILRDRYETAETTIKKILKNTVGVRKVRTDKTKTTTNNEIKQNRKRKQQGKNSNKPAKTDRPKKKKYNTWKAKNNSERK